MLVNSLQGPQHWGTQVIRNTADCHHLLSSSNHLWFIHVNVWDCSVKKQGANLLLYHHTYYVHNSENTVYMNVYGIKHA